MLPWGWGHWLLFSSSSVQCPRLSRVGRGEGGDLLWLVHKVYRVKPFWRSSPRARLALRTRLTFASTHQKKNAKKYACSACQLAFYIVTPGPAIWLELFASTSCSFFITNIIFIFVQLFFRDCRNFTPRKLYVFLKMLLCSLYQFIDRIQRRNNNYYGMNSTPTVEMWLTFHI